MNRVTVNNPPTSLNLTYAWGWPNLACICSFSKHFLSSSYEAGTIPLAWNIAVDETDKDASPWGCVYQRRQTFDNRATETV
ncbi:hypothetical protein ACRRTK_000156 [Alexandromys fortis]